MKSNPAFRSVSRAFAFAILVSISTSVFAQMPATAPTGLGSVEREIADKVTIESIRQMTMALAAPDMEGRGTGQPGGDRAANRIAERYKALGLKPLGDKGSYLQKVDFKETVATEETTFTVGDQSLKFGDEFAPMPQNNGNKNVSGDMVFLSFAIVAKSSGIDQIGSVNLQGKVAVIVQGPPPGVTQEQWDKQKLQMAFIRNLVMGGASAIVIIGRGTEKNPPEEAISYFSRRQLALPDEEGFPPQLPPFVYVSAKGAEKLFVKSGVTREEALEQAVTREFKPFDLKQKAKIVAKYKIAKVTGSNVVGVLEGSDPKLKSEAIVFSAHYDAYGKEGDKVYPGAADNALGTSEMLAVAEAYSKLEQKPKRSVVFLAVTGEEYGLYGSKYWAKKPTWDIKKVAANLNLDGIGSEVYGPVKTMIGYGAEHSTMGGVLDELAKLYDITVIPDPKPENKVFLRSDHYSFVQRGVPALMLQGVPAGDKEIWLKRIEDWEKVDYHQPGDTIQANWAWEGAETVAEIMGILGWRISEADAMPSWLPSSRFSKYDRGNTKEIPEDQ